MKQDDIYIMIHVQVTQSHQFIAVDILQVTQSELDLGLVRTILGEYKIHNADVTLK